MNNTSDASINIAIILLSLTVLVNVLFLPSSVYAAGLYCKEKSETTSVIKDDSKYLIGVTVVDAMTNVPLMGVVIGLYNSSLPDGILLETLPNTDINGYAQTSNGYEPGNYYVNVISMINGYEQSSMYHQVVINVDQSNPISTITLSSIRIPDAIYVTKVDEISKLPLQGVVFGLYDGNSTEASLLETLPATNVSGKSKTTSSYPAGMFYLKEISTIRGYELDPVYYAVLVDIFQPGGATAITVDNARTPYPIGVNVLDTDTETPLQGVVFGLYKDIAPDASYLEILPATDVNGSAQTIGDYAPGTYYLKEISTINGYELDMEYHAIVVNIGQEGEIATYTGANIKSPISKVSIINTVKNITANDEDGKTAVGTAGDDFLLSINIINYGETELTNLIVTDNKAVIGSTATVNGVSTPWTSGIDGFASLSISSLAVNQAVKITYVYNTETNDRSMTRSNIVAVTGIAGSASETVRATDSITLSISELLSGDRASIITSIPSEEDISVLKTGETTNTGEPITAMTLVFISGCLVTIFFVHMSYKHKNIKYK